MTGRSAGAIRLAPAGPRLSPRCCALPDVTGARQSTLPRRCCCSARDSPLLLAATRCAIGTGRGPRLVCRDDHRGVLRPEGRPRRPHRRRARSRCRRSASGCGHAATAQPPGSPRSSPSWGCCTTTPRRRSGPGSTAAPANCPPGSAATSVPGWWCCSTATPAPAPGRTPRVRVHFGSRAALHRALGSNTRPPAGDHLRRRRRRPGAAARSPALQRHHRAALAVPVRQTTRPDVRRPHPAPRGGRGAGRTMLPMTAEQIRAVQQAAVTPAQRLAIALAAVHAARPGAIRELTLDDIDLPSRRITIAGHRQPLGELTRNALLAWLGYRRATWPDTANRHVLISRISALGTGPVSARLPRQAPAAAASPSSTSGATASCTKPWPPAPTRSTLPWSSTSTTPTRWPTPTPPATFSAARPNRHCYPPPGMSTKAPSAAGKSEGRASRWPLVHGAARLPRHSCAPNLRSPGRPARRGIRGAALRSRAATARFAGRI